jgi:hypothetical protein
MKVEAMKVRAGQLAQGEADRIDTMRANGYTDDDLRASLDRLAILRAVAGGELEFADGQDWLVIGGGA